MVTVNWLCGLHLFTNSQHNAVQLLANQFQKINTSTSRWILNTLVYIDIAGVKWRGQRVRWPLNNCTGGHCRPQYSGQCSMKYVNIHVHVTLCAKSSCDSQAVGLKWSFFHWLHMNTLNILFRVSLYSKVHFWKYLIIALSTWILTKSV